MQEPEILLKPISELAASVFFKEGSAIMGFDTLQAIVKTAPSDLMSKKGFNYVWFGELIDFLTEQGLLHLLQPIQGNSRV